MLKNLFAKTPTVEQYTINPSLEQCKKIMFEVLWTCKKIQKIYKKYNDLEFTGKHELINHEYYQIWKSEEQNQVYIAYCRDIRNPVEIIWKGLS